MTPHQVAFHPASAWVEGPVNEGGAVVEWLEDLEKGEER
jgi:hypothetical protein